MRSRRKRFRLDFWVQLADFPIKRAVFAGDVAQVRFLFQRDVHGFEFVRREFVLVVNIKSVAFGIGENDFGGNHAKHVAFRFAREFQLIIIADALPPHRVLHAAFAAIVGGQRERPIMKHAVQFFQIFDRGLRGGIEIAAIIEPRRLRQAVGVAGRPNKLPISGRARRGRRSGAQPAFDNRDVFQIIRQTGALKLFFDVREELTAPLQPENHLPLIHQKREKFAVQALPDIPFVYRDALVAQADDFGQRVHFRQMIFDLLRQQPSALILIFHQFRDHAGHRFILLLQIRDAGRKFTDLAEQQFHYVFEHFLL